MSTNNISLSLSLSLSLSIYQVVHRWPEKIKYTYMVQKKKMITLCYRISDTNKYNKFNKIHGSSVVVKKKRLKTMTRPEQSNVYVRCKISTTL